ncbi:SETMR methyltransferase, partial [Acromyrmex charruanus]
MCKWVRGSAKLFANFKCHVRTWRDLKYDLIEEFAKTMNSRQVHKKLSAIKKLLYGVTTIKDLRQRFLQYETQKINRDKLKQQLNGVHRTKTLERFSMGTVIDHITLILSFDVVSDHFIDHHDLLIGGELLELTEIRICKRQASLTKINDSSKHRAEVILQFHAKIMDILLLHLIKEETLRTQVRELIEEYRPEKSKDSSMKMHLALKDEVPNYSIKHLSISPIVLIEKKNGEPRLCLKRLKLQVLLTARQLRINWKKSSLLVRQVEYLGHVVENGTMKPSNKKVQAVTRFPESITAILLQKNDEDNLLHPIYYTSWKTTETEECYTSYELEVLAKAFVQVISKKDACLCGSLNQTSRRFKRSWKQKQKKSGKAEGLLQPLDKGDLPLETIGLHAIGMVQKEGNWVPYKLKERDMERCLVICFVNDNKIHFTPHMWQQRLEMNTSESLLFAEVNDANNVSGNNISSNQLINNSQDVGHEPQNSFKSFTQSWIQKGVRWVPHELSVKNMMDRINICDTLLKRNEIEPFLKRMITGDEIRITYDNRTLKRSWIKEGKKAQAKPGLTKKVMLAIERKRPELINRRDIVFHHDNARPHISLITWQKLRELGWS